MDLVVEEDEDQEMIMTQTFDIPKNTADFDPNRSPATDSLFLEIPKTHIAFTNDLQIKFLMPNTNKYEKQTLILQIVEGNTIIAKEPIVSRNQTIIIACDLLFKNTNYFVEIVDSNHLILYRKIVSVIWPQFDLTISENVIETLSNNSIIAILKRRHFGKLKCEDSGKALKQNLNLLYCGITIQDCNLTSENRKLLNSTEVHGFPLKKVLTLKSILFGSAGFYRLSLFQYIKETSFVLIQAKWNSAYSFDLVANYVFPCDIHSGIKVIFEYPNQILKTGDVIRVHGKSKSNVASHLAPSQLEYINEKRFYKGDYKLFFDCEIFSEKYIEYCFTYVIQTVNGATFNFLSKCIPTYENSVENNGKWGPWSNWTKCTSQCFGGTRNRHRFCDSPAPKYGGQFCQGNAVQTEACNQYDWNCFYDIDIDKEISTENDLIFNDRKRCRCGCIIVLSETKPVKYIGSLSNKCPGKHFWIVQTSANSTIHVDLKNYRFSCENQWLKIRDGDGILDNLIIHVDHTTSNYNHFSVQTNRNITLIEFFSQPLIFNSTFCSAIFILKVTQIGGELSDFNETSLMKSPFLTFLKWFYSRTTLVHAINCYKYSIWILTTLVIVSCLYMIFHYLCRFKMIGKSGDSELIIDNSSLSSFSFENKRTSSIVTLLTEKMLNFDKNKGSNEFKKLISSPMYKEYIKSPKIVKWYEKFRKRRNLVRKKWKSHPNTPNISPKTLKRSFTSPLLELVDVLKSEKICLEKLYEKSNSVSKPIESKTKLKVSKSSLSTKILKEKCNKLIAKSEFSIYGAETELEMDYYDYDVENAAAAPGSYLAMDPTFLFWIPPIDADIEEDSESIEKQDATKNSENCWQKNPQEFVTAETGKPAFFEKHEDFF